MKKWILTAAAMLLIVLAAWAVMQKDSTPPKTVPPDSSLNQPGAAPGPAAGENEAPEVTEPPEGEQDRHGVYQGDRAFVFELTDLEGNTFKLSDYSDRVVLLSFWQTTCSWCREELPLMDQLYKTYKDGEVTVLAINVGEDREEVSQFVAEEGYTFPVLLDTDAEASKKYLVSYLPTNYVVNRRGEISAVHIGLMDYDTMVGYIEAAFKE